MEPIWHGCLAGADLEEPAIARATSCDVDRDMIYLAKNSDLFFKADLVFLKQG